MICEYIKILNMLSILPLNIDTIQSLNTLDKQPFTDFRYNKIEHQLSLSA